jgi:hypothetical protein
MQPPPLDPDVADAAPSDSVLAVYDEQHVVTYLRLLDADAEGADWRDVARIVRGPVNETARIAAIRELLDRGFGRSRQAVEVSAPAGDPLQLLFEEIDALSRKPDRYKQYSKEPT